MGKLSEQSMAPEEFEQMPVSSLGDCFGLAESLSLALEARNQRDFSNQASLSYSSEG